MWNLVGTFSYNPGLHRAISDGKPMGEIARKISWKRRLKNQCDCCERTALGYASDLG